MNELRYRIALIDNLLSMARNLTDEEINDRAAEEKEFVDRLDRFEKAMEKNNETMESIANRLVQIDGTLEDMVITAQAKIDNDLDLDSKKKSKKKK